MTKTAMEMPRQSDVRLAKAGEPVPSDEQMIRRDKELQILIDISAVLHSSPKLDEVLQEALMAILRTLRLKMGAVYLMGGSDAGRHELRLAAHHGFGSTLTSDIQRFSVSDKWVERFDSHEPVVWFPREGIFFPTLRKRMAEEHIEEIIRIPLFTRKGVLGLLYLANHGDLQVRPDRKAFLATIGHQIGVAIENAQLLESVQRARMELEITFDAIQHSIFLIDHKSRILRINRTSEAVYGGMGCLIGRLYWDVLYQRDEPPSDCPITECLHSKRPVQREGPHPLWDGYYRYYAFPVLNRSGQLERVVYYEKDETEARKLEQRLQQNERLKALGTLAAGIAHEIRNPLATINFNAQLLHRELSLEPTQQEMFHDLIAEAKKIDAIVRQVLSFARPREPQFLPANLNAIVRNCYQLVRVHSRKTPIEFTLDLDEKVPPLVMDQDQITQVLMNLVINAVEAMPNGGTLRVSTRWFPDTASVVLEVRDSGEGILPEDQDRIFDPFFTRKTEGTGLGLSISRQILERHGAHIDVESRADSGTAFRVTFPSRWSRVLV
ncbi:sensor histidine kinase [Desulfoglaeba alkanexedens]|uniref:histidine kinase n=1 Tax=Desulfoglaeba alkanexedens ALDC TaxID=980445 RepID=A0A4P8L4W4_9BACT|nr:sensor histidine kinase [Desulfoglaeba alkanexedens]QCQ21812.1 GAF domain-containing protein [Desulfoglaeba alkanexedens ALDC]